MCPPPGELWPTHTAHLQVMRVLGVPLPFYKSPTLLLGWGVSPFVFWQLLKARPDVIHAAFPGAQPAQHWHPCWSAYCYT